MRATGAWSRARARAERIASGGRRRAAPLTVSVVVNTINRCELLERTLESLREQSHEAFEVIVVNGPSVDGTAQMLERFRDSARLADCDVAVLGRSRNVGIALAAGEIVAFIDDAIPAADWLERLLEPYGDPAVAGVGGPVFDIPLDRVAWRLCTCTRLGVPDPDSEGPIERYTTPGADPLAYLPGCNMSYRRSVLEQAGGFNELLSNSYDDVEISARVIDSGHRIALVEEVLVRHDRAANAARDDRQWLRDPYPDLSSRAVFAYQCPSPGRSETEVEQVLETASEQMAELARGLHAEQHLTDEERDRFIERARRGVLDGSDAGRGERRVVALPAPRPELFRPYRT